MDETERIFGTFEGAAGLRGVPTMNKRLRKKGKKRGMSSEKEMLLGSNQDKRRLYAFPTPVAKVESGGGEKN